ncbi:SH3 domain-containing protein [Helicobacter himalayensis]|uniref:SH3 domain-containing protein n=1 Tax=Helicobacter himalayensis TaxID=1591088 RepID=UPI00082C9B09|nr:SH3 domain-containing protein [Helicobacter himalayensis]
MPLKSLVKLYSIPTLIVIVGICLYYFVFLGLKDRDIDNNVQFIAQDTPQKHSPKQEVEILYAKAQDEPQSTTPAIAQTTQESENQIPQIQILENLENTQTLLPPQVATTQAQDFAILQDSSQAQTLQNQVIAQSARIQDSSQNLNTEKLAPTTPQTTTYALITAKSVNVRAQPDTQSAIVKRAQFNEGYELVKNHNDWLEIKLNNAQNGYVVAYLAKIVEEKDLPQHAQNASLANPHHTQDSLHSNVQERDFSLYEVIAHRANVRAHTSVDSAVIASIESGKKVRVLETLTIDDVAWAHVLLNSGSEGYIALRLLKEVQ